MSDDPRVPASSEPRPENPITMTASAAARLREVLAERDEARAERDALKEAGDRLAAIALPLVDAGNREAWHDAVAAWRRTGDREA